MLVVAMASTRRPRWRRRAGAAISPANAELPAPVEDDPEVGPTDDLAQEPGGLRISAPRDLAPGVGLLSDLENRCAAVFLGGHSVWAGNGDSSPAPPVVRARGLSSRVRHAFA